jgi:hypothetical protein
VRPQHKSKSGYTHDEILALPELSEISTAAPWECAQAALVQGIELREINMRASKRTKTELENLPGRVPKTNGKLGRGARMVKAPIGLALY